MLAPYSYRAPTQRWGIVCVFYSTSNWNSIPESNYETLMSYKNFSEEHTSYNQTIQLSVLLCIAFCLCARQLIPVAVCKKAKPFLDHPLYKLNFKRSSPLWPRENKLKTLVLEERLNNRIRENISAETEFQGTWKKDPRWYKENTKHWWPKHQSSLADMI